MVRRVALVLSLLFTVTAHAAPVDNKDGFWNEWSDGIFAKAATEKKFVIVSLQSWWCRWCHVMNRETWANAEVRGVLKDKFIPVYVDQDSQARHLAALRALGLARHHHLRPRRHRDRQIARLLFAAVFHARS